MADIIHILPDNVANQIAAGEVIQRPASVVKELMENSVDSGADKIELIIKDAGRTLIQVVDDGCGMSETDARMALEKHATSKINEAKDLFAIKTMGFRGEAMASIAAIAHLEIKTKMHDKELGNKLVAEGSEVKEQIPNPCPSGSNIMVKNLFFNLPARRNFLKSDNVEMRHITQAFERIALSYPTVGFKLVSNGRELFNLQKGNFKQRIIGLFGKRYNERLIPVSEKSNIVNISGFVAKPEHAKKSKGEQFIFVNGRYIRSNYLNHSIKLAFKDLITDNSYPSFFLKLEVDPAKIDINIHPTKTEVKFEEEQSIYAIIKTAVKQSLGKFNVAPSIDFDVEQSLNFSYKKDKSDIHPPEIKVDPTFNPFKDSSSSGGQQKRKSTRIENERWLDNLKSVQRDSDQMQQEEKTESLNPEWNKETYGENNLFLQLQNKYIFTAIPSGMLVIDQVRAHERILFEYFLKETTNPKSYSQQLLFPEEIQLSSADLNILKEIKKEINALGFDFTIKEDKIIIVNGTPFEKDERNLQEVFETFIEQYRLQSKIEDTKREEKLASSLAKSLRMRKGIKLSMEEIRHLIDQLFACKMPYYLPGGQPIIITLGNQELKKWFKY